MDSELDLDISIHESELALLEYSKSSILLVKYALTLNETYDYSILTESYSGEFMKQTFKSLQATLGRMFEKIMIFINDKLLTIRSKTMQIHSKKILTHKHDILSIKKGRYDMTMYTNIDKDITMNLESPIDEIDKLVSVLVKVYNQGSDKLTNSVKYTMGSFTDPREYLSQSKITYSLMKKMFPKIKIRNLESVQNVTDIREIVTNYLNGDTIDVADLNYINMHAIVENIENIPKMLINLQQSIVRVKQIHGKALSSIRSASADINSITVNQHIAKHVTDYVLLVKEVVHALNKRFTCSIRLCKRILDENFESKGDNN